MRTVPWPKHFFPLQILRRTSLCFTDQETQEENTHGGPTPFWVSTYHQLSLAQSSRSIQRMQTVPWPKRFFPLQILEKTSLCFTDQETQEENRHGGPTPSWVSTYTSYLLYKVQDLFSACRQSHGRNVFFLLQFLGKTSLCFTDQETQEENTHGGPTPFLVSTYTSYLLYKVQDPFSACRQSHGRNAFLLFSF